MNGFQPRTSGIGSDHSANWATTTVHQSYLGSACGIDYFDCFLNNISWLFHTKMYWQVHLKFVLNHSDSANLAVHPFTYYWIEHFKGKIMQETLTYNCSKHGLNKQQYLYTNKTHSKDIIKVVTQEHSKKYKHLKCLF